ncbi:MAG: protein phosphatase 2C domain-containing protein [Promethearchaeota archaeon]|jgi:hypothetical protein
MRRNSDNWTVTCGVKVGHHHLYKGANCQDAACLAAIPASNGFGEIVIGVGCDGCGEGQNSEMGAIALANYILRECLQHHSRGRAPSKILEYLFYSVVQFVDTNVRLTVPFYGDPSRDAVEVAEFIKNHWLATILGFILTPEQSLIFWCGDGVFKVDDGDLLYIDQENVPKYIGYNSLYRPQSVGVADDNIPTQFFWEEIYPQERVMVASDGFTTFNQDKLAAAREKEELPDELDGQQWGKKGQFGLKKWMNSRSDRGYFDDDCFIVTAERRCNE